MTSLRWTVADAAAMTWRNLVRYWRIPQLLVFSTVQPVMFLVLFNYVFGGAIATNLPPGSNYIDYLLPGLLVQSTIFGATQTGVGLADDMQRGFVDRFKSLPMARSAVLAGRTTSDMLRNVFVVVLTVIVGFALGFRLHEGVPAALLALVLLVLFGFAFSWVSASIGLAVKDTESAQAAGFFWVFPLAFASAIFVPIETLPSWLQVFARLNPATFAANAVRALTYGQLPPGACTTAAGCTAGTLVWIAAILVVFVPLGVRQYRRVV